VGVTKSALAPAPNGARAPGRTGGPRPGNGGGTRNAPPASDAPPRAGPAVLPPPAQDTTGDWAICCSGGGIRSATYCLGGLQSLQEGGLLGRARWIVGVSGGSYIAASRALVARGLGRADDERPAYARGTPEEQNLRNNTHYIAPDAKTGLVAVLSLLLGATVTCILALAPVFALGHAWGWLLRARGVLTWSGGQASASVNGWTWWLAPAVAAAVTMALFLRWWATLGSGSPGRGTRRARWIGWAAAVTAGLALLMLAAPLLIAWLYHSTGALGTVVRFFGVGGSGRWSPATLAGLVAAVTAVAGYSQKQLARLRLPSAAAGPSAGTVARLAAWARGTLTPWLASLVIIAGGAFAAVLWIAGAARAGYSPGTLVPVLVALGVMLATRATADINRTSLHDFYRWRLADAYAVTRRAVRANTAQTREKLFAEAAGTRLSDLAGDQGGPTLVIATTANINADRAAPPGRGGFCLAFDPAKVRLRGDPLAGEPEVEVDTADYEHLLGHTRFTLFDVVAISGAAFSPLMGAATRGAYRLVLTLTNMRLGIWMPHPEVVRRARAYLDQPPGPGEKDRWWIRRTGLLLLWYLLPLPFSRRDAGKQKQREQREARLWAHVLGLRERSTEGPGSLRSILARLRAALCWRAMQPTLGMLWAEAAGHTSYRATWINVTDGGHYDNLGLVEALRRGARNIVVLDASGDRTDTWFTLGGAIALARADAGVEISLDPTTMIGGNGRCTPPRLGHGQVLRPWARGTFTWPGGHAGNGHAGNGHAGNGHAGNGHAGNGHAGNGHAGNGQFAGNGQSPAGNIWICKLGWWEGAPWDIRAYAAGHPGYPCDSTLRQLFDGAEFEAYHELGACSVTAAATAGRLPLGTAPSLTRTS
jgi:hypothetical protein